MSKPCYQGCRENNWMKNRWVECLLVVAVSGLGVGCDNGATSTSNSIAAAMGHVAKGKDEAEAKVHASERMKVLREQAEAEAAKAKEEAYAALIVVPANVDNDLKSACAAAAEAFDTFHTTRLAGSELQRWQATKQPDLDKFGEACRGLGSTKVAACQANAFANASALFVVDDAPIILTQCEERAGVAPTRTAAL
ncbi:MAG: hypothetical protein AAF721_30565 [Myxococcota bacterium]